MQAKKNRAKKKIGNFIISASVDLKTYQNQQIQLCIATNKRQLNFSRQIGPMPNYEIFVDDSI